MAIENSLWAASSAPRSQVSDVMTPLGRCFTCRTIALTTVEVSFPFTLTSTRKRERRSTNVCDVRVVGAADEVALPVTWYGAILHFGGTICYRNRVRN